MKDHGATESKIQIAVLIPYILEAPNVIQALDSDEFQTQLPARLDLLAWCHFESIMLNIKNRILSTPGLKHFIFTHLFKF